MFHTNRFFRIRGMHMLTGAEIYGCTEVADVPSESTIVSGPRRFGNAQGEASESFAFKVGLASEIKFWIRLEPSASGDFVVKLCGAASRYGLPTIIAYFGQNASFADAQDPDTNKHTDFFGVGALPPSSGFSMGTNLEEAPQTMLRDISRFRNWQRLVFKLNWFPSSPQKVLRMPAAHRRSCRHGWVSVFINEIELDWWIPFMCGGDERGWNVITGVNITATDMVGWISDFTVSYSEESLWVLQSQHEAHLDYLNEVWLPARREQELEYVSEYDSGSSDNDDDNDASEERGGRSRRSRRSGRARRRSRRFRDEIQRCPSPAFDC